MNEEKDEYGLTTEGRMNFDDCAESLGLDDEMAEDLLQCYGGWIAEIFNC